MLREGYALDRRSRVDRSPLRWEAVIWFGARPPSVPDEFRQLAGAILVTDATGTVRTVVLQLRTKWLAGEEGIEPSLARFWRPPLCR